MFDFHSYMSLRVIVLLKKYSPIHISSVKFNVTSSVSIDIDIFECFKLCDNKNVFAVELFTACLKCLLLGVSGVSIHSRDAVSLHHPRADSAELASSHPGISDGFVSKGGSPSQRSISAKRTGGAGISHGIDGQI